jgi:hypothetical protein
LYPFDRREDIGNEERGRLVRPGEGLVHCNVLVGSRRGLVNVWE